MTGLFHAAAYAVPGLVGGLPHREPTKAHEGFTGFTQLAAVHPHLLTLGTLVLLVVLALAKVFGLTRSRWFGRFFWLWNAGVLLTAAMVTVHGTRTVPGLPVSPCVAASNGDRWVRPARVAAPREQYDAQPRGLSGGPTGRPRLHHDSGTRSR